MKKHLNPHKSFTPFFNLGLHQPEKSISVHWENSCYERNTETLENSIRKSLQVTEFITFFWTLLETRTTIAIVNTEEEHVFYYENWFEGTQINCYEGTWIPGLWSNSRLKNPMPDLVILLSVNSTDRAATLRAIETLCVPVINFSPEDSPWKQFTWDIRAKHQLTYFYMELMRFLLLRFQQRQMFLETAAKFRSDRIDLKFHIRHLLDCFRNQKSTLYPWKVWSPLKKPGKKKLKTQHIKKNLISLKKGRGFSRRGFATVSLTRLISFPKKISGRKKKGALKKPISGYEVSRRETSFGWTGK